MENYILWFANRLWKVFDPISFEMVAEFTSREQAVAYIECRDEG